MVLLSLFDHSGAWSQPFADAGWEVHQIDLQDDERHDVRKFDCQYYIEELGIEWVDAILAAVPCDHFASSGAGWWKAKDKDGRTAQGIELTRQALRSIEFWKPDFWAIENPVGRLSRLVPEVGRPAYWEPWHYAGFMDATLTPEQLARLEQLGQLPKEEFSREDIELVRQSNRYTKKTGLWGNFTMPTPDPRPPIKVCEQGSWLQKLSGQGADTKNLRSMTPEGFAHAFFQANKDRRQELVEGEYAAVELPPPAPVGFAISLQ